MGDVPITNGQWTCVYVCVCTSSVGTGRMGDSKTYSGDILSAFRCNIEGRFILFIINR